MQTKIFILVTASLVSAAALLSGRQEALVQVAESHSDTQQTATSAQSAAAVASRPNAAAIQPSAQPATPPVRRPALSLHNAGGNLSTHQHDPNEPDNDLPELLTRDIEQRRLPVSQLVLKPVPGGYAMPARGQHHTVVMAYIGEDGKLHHAERKVEPIPDTLISVPAPPPAQQP
ncbi:MAG: hypothetical protein CMI02_12315 [Oceanospirillaceae bacterium]|nr:hypothetical protein [Oceanospirillaceae bacterium]MBT12805.1 hypothetical protein [Oceanospirillaceae bacterium]